MSRNSNGSINNGRRILQTGQCDRNAKIEINLASKQVTARAQDKDARLRRNFSPAIITRARESITLRYNEKNVTTWKGVAPFRSCGFARVSAQG